jgi:hypothetical protein
MGQNKKRTRKSSSQRRKPIQGNRATSANAKKPHAKTSSAKKSHADKVPLAAHLEKFAKAVAEGFDGCDVSDRYYRPEWRH